jgi:hypothetical protein
MDVPESTPALPRRYTTAVPEGQGRWVKPPRQFSDHPESGNLSAASGHLEGVPLFSQRVPIYRVLRKSKNSILFTNLF